MEPGSESETQRATGRNYRGVRITTPPRADSDGHKDGGLTAQIDRELSQRPPGKSFGRSQQARILTGSALFGVIVIVLLHEFGHWITGFAVTGRAPDFLFVAVRQKVSDFSTIGGIITWGSGPLLHLAAIWAAIVFVTSRSRSHPRLFAMTGGAILFTLVVHLVNWTGATFTSTDSWGNDLPKVATFFGSLARVWMHLMSIAFATALLLPAYVWMVAARSTGNQALYVTPAVVGAIQGGVLVLIATLFIAFTE